MPVHIPLLYGEVPLGAHQTCSWGFIKRDVQRQTRQDVHIYPLSTVAQGILGVQRKSNWVDTFRLELEHKATCIMMTQLWSDNPGYAVVTMGRNEALLTFSLLSAFRGAGENSTFETADIFGDGLLQRPTVKYVLQNHRNV